MKRMMQRQGQVEPEGSFAPATARTDSDDAPRPAPARTPSGPRTAPAEFLREVRGELRRVAWPTREEVANYSMVVLFTLVLLVGFIFLLNLGFSHAISALFGT